MNELDAGPYWGNNGGTGMAQGCPNVAKHTPCPEGYVARQSWAAAMLSARWSQGRCRACGLYVIWTPPYPDAPMPARHKWAYACVNCGVEARAASTTTERE